VKPNFSFRIDPELLAKLKAAADKDGRPLGNLLNKILTDWVKEKEKGDG
jgi:hypothetical protein